MLLQDSLRIQGLKNRNVRTKNLIMGECQMYFVSQNIKPGYSHFLYL